MNKIEKESLKEILRKHKMWLENEHDGERVNLRGADLYRADLSGADLSGADLSESDLREANLRGVNLRGVNLRGADLYRADLSGADLSESDLREANLYRTKLGRANLSGADLSGADLSESNLSESNFCGAYLIGADFSESDLREAKNINIPLACPEKGSFIGFKKVYDTFKNGTCSPLIAELEITEDAIRCSDTGRKCRCSKAKVLSITELDSTSASVSVAHSGRNPGFKYKVGEIVKVEDFDKNRWNECSTGIHFFITRQEAVDY